MRGYRSKIWALILTLTMVPGAAEMAENAFHLVTEGHTAHAQSSDDTHDHAGPEHSCTPTFHSCACHASSVLHVAGHPAPAPLGLSGFRPHTRAASISKSFWPRIDHPPQA